MRAIILAAGVGSRLYPLTRNTPKSLIEIGDGVTLLENQLLSLSNAGIIEVCIVTGYLTEQIEAKIKNLKGVNCEITTIYNPFYDISNNLVSLWFAKEYMKTDFIIINGDDIFTSDVITTLLTSSSKDLVFTIDKKNKYDPDDMKLVISHDIILKIGKNIPLEEANGESIGIMKVSGKLKHLFLIQLEKMVRDKQYHNVFYLEVFQQLINLGVPINYVEVSEDSWAEMDYHPDLESIRNNVSVFTKKWGFHSTKNLE